MSTISFGSDPEFLLTKNGKPQSAIGVIQGGPDNRIEIKGHQFYYDNVLAECAIKPGDSKDEVIENIRECLKIYANMVKPFVLTLKASIEFPESQLNHPEARKAGCAPDTCAYLLKQIDAPKQAIEKNTLRSCGGHIHIGSDLLASDGAEPILMIYMLDLFVGTASVFLDNDPTARRRRALYGNAGRYRAKNYGLEYRSLSNFWFRSPAMTGLIYDLCMFAHNYVLEGKAWNMWAFDEEVFYTTTTLSDAWTCKTYDPILLQSGINQSDKDVLKSYFDMIIELLPANLQSDLQSMKREGDFYKNWNLS